MLSFIRIAMVMAFLHSNKTVTKAKYFLRYYIKELEINNKQNGKFTIMWKLNNMLLIN